MIKILLDAELRKKLLNLTELVELVDEQGKVLATVFPQADPALYQNVECPHDEAELRRRETSNARRYSLSGSARTSREIVMFQVDYLEQVLDDLAAAWIGADAQTRQRITAAANALDVTLQRNPHFVGESRPGGRRILFELPLVAIYRIEPDGRTVTVVDMWVV